MNDPIATFPNETYLNGLRDADAAVVDSLYHEFRQPISKAIEATGGTYADGNAFFRIALIQTARMIHAGTYPEQVPVYDFLKALTLAQYRGWLHKKGQEIQVDKAAFFEVHEHPEGLPTEAEMEEIRQQVQAKRQFNKLSIEDQRQVIAQAHVIAGAQAEGKVVDPGSSVPSVERYKNLLEARGVSWENTLPEWVITTLINPNFHQIWSATEAMERRYYSSQVPASSENKTIRNAFILFVLLTLGYAAFTWINRDQSPASVYEDNFQPPASIVEDMAARYAKDSVPIVRPEACTIAFSEADAHYKKREWREAAGILAQVMDDTLKSCQSDALFYLAIVGLELDKPELTLECIAKIEDLDRFGEDIYWYMALAYVKIAALEPDEKDIARRAVQRALSNTEIPERRAQAEKMLEELGE